MAAGAGTGGSSPALARRMFPRTADFTALLGDQAQVAVEALEALAEFAAHGRGGRRREGRDHREAGATGCASATSTRSTGRSRRCSTATSRRSPSAASTTSPTTPRPRCGRWGMLAMEPDAHRARDRRAPARGRRAQGAAVALGGDPQLVAGSHRRGCTRPSGRWRRSTARPSPSSSAAGAGAPWGRRMRDRAPARRPAAARGLPAPLERRRPAGRRRPGRHGHRRRHGVSDGARMPGGHTAQRGRVRRTSIRSSRIPQTGPRSRPAPGGRDPNARPPAAAVRITALQSDVHEGPSGQRVGRSTGRPSPLQRPRPARRHGPSRPAGEPVGDSRGVVAGGQRGRPCRGWQGPGRRACRWRTIGPSTRVSSPASAPCPSRWGRWAVKA